MKLMFSTSSVVAVRCILLACRAVLVKHLYNLYVLAGLALPMQAVLFPPLLPLHQVVAAYNDGVVAVLVPLLISQLHEEYSTGQPSLPMHTHLRATCLLGPRACPCVPAQVG